MIKRLALLFFVFSLSVQTYGKKTNKCAVLYEGSEFRGKKYEFCPGKQLPSLKVWNDDASSLKVPPGGKLKVCESVERGVGKCWIYTKDSKWIGKPQNDKYSYLEYCVDDCYMTSKDKGGCSGVSFRLRSNTRVNGQAHEVGDLCYYEMDDAKKKQVRERKQLVKEAEDLFWIWKSYPTHPLRWGPKKITLLCNRLRVVKSRLERERRGKVKQLCYWQCRKYKLDWCKRWNKDGSVPKPKPEPKFKKKQVDWGDVFFQMWKKDPQQVLGWAPDDIAMLCKRLPMMKLRISRERWGKAKQLCYRKCKKYEKAWKWDWCGKWK